MARQTEFDRDALLRQAMHIFWQKGYNTTSIKDIIEATKVQPGSLYWAFGNKEQLFLAALEQYSQDMQAIISRTLKADLPPLLRIRQFFAEMVAHTPQNDCHQGCLLINTLLETRDNDVAIKQAIKETFNTLEQTLEQVLKLAQEQREISAEKNLQDLAKLLVVGLYGLRVYQKYASRQNAVNAVIDNLLQAITK